MWYKILVFSFSGSQWEVWEKTLSQRLGDVKVSSHDEMLILFDKIALDVFMGGLHKLQGPLPGTKMLCVALGLVHVVHGTRHIVKMSDYFL